jgi:hypothetical protein
MRKYKAAIAQRNIQNEAHDGWTARLPKELTDEWEILCETWENAPFPKEDIENPFAVTNECESVAL